MTAFSQVFIIGIQLAGLLIIVLIDPYIHRKQRRVMLLILSAVGCLMLQNMAEYSLSVREASLTVIRLRTATSVIGYSLRPLIIVLFFFPDPLRAAFPAGPGSDGHELCGTLYGLFFPDLLLVR